jgi:hypothetical protein
VTPLLTNLLAISLAKIRKAWVELARIRDSLPINSQLYSLVAGLKGQFVCTTNQLLSSFLYFRDNLHSEGPAVLDLHLVQDACKSNAEKIFHWYDQSKYLYSFFPQPFRRPSFCNYKHLTCERPLQNFYKIFLELYILRSLSHPILL